LLLLFFILFLWTGKTRAQNDCSNFSLNEARKKYDLGQFNECIRILEPCIYGGFNQKQLGEAYKILSLTYHAVDSFGLSKYYASQILNIKADYEADLLDPPFFIELIENLKLQKSSVLVSSVSKKAEKVEEAPATVLLITRKEILERGYTDLEALFRDIPGFDMSRVYGATLSNIYQRGYRSSNTNRTLFMIDGVEENDLWSHTAFFSYQYPISNIKRVEVIYGPASTMYGANAFVGVVNIITMDPDEISGGNNFGINIDAGTGTFNTKYADMALAGKHKNVSLSLTLRRYSSDEMDLSDYPEFDFNPDDYNKSDYEKLLTVYDNASTFLQADQNNYYDLKVQGEDSMAVPNARGIEAARRMDQYAIRQNYRGHPIAYSNTSEHWYLYGKIKFENFKLGYQLWRYEQGSLNYFNDSRNAGAKNGQIWVPKQSMYYAMYEKEISEDFSIMNFMQYRICEVDDETQMVSVNNYANRGLGPSDLIKNVVPRYTSLYFYQISRQFRNEIKATYRLFNRLYLVSGFEIRQSDLQGDYRLLKTYIPSSMDSGASSGDAYPGGNNFSIIDLGVYTQGTIPIMNGLNFTFGSRYDYNRVRKSFGFGSHFNPRLALVFSRGNYIAKIIYAEAFQDASNWDKFSVAPGRIAAPYLEPEKVKNTEIALIRNFKNNISVELSAFYSSYKDVVHTFFDTSTGLSQNQNLGALQITGLESRLLFTKEIYDLSFYYTFCKPMNNRLENGQLTGDYQRIGDISSHKATLISNIHCTRKINVNIRANYYSEKPVGEKTTVEANKENFPALFLLHAGLSWNIMKGCTLQVNCNNILNTEYFDPGIRSADGIVYASRIPQKKRYFMFRINYNLN
jgi:outer membrane receptor for ferrienterochelin and colicins